MEKFSWLRYTKPHPGSMWYCFVGKNFVVRLSTTKTMKIPPLVCTGGFLAVQPALRVCSGFSQTLNEPGSASLFSAWLQPPHPLQASLLPRPHHGRSQEQLRDQLCPRMHRIYMYMYTYISIQVTGMCKTSNCDVLLGM